MSHNLVNLGAAATCINKCQHGGKHVSCFIDKPLPFTEIVSVFWIV
jgi:hypothetical protein